MVVTEFQINIRESMYFGNKMDISTIKGNNQRLREINQKMFRLIIITF